VIKAVFIGAALKGVSGAGFLANFSGVNNFTEFIGKSRIYGLSFSPGMGLSVGGLKLGRQWAGGALGVSGEFGIDVGPYWQEGHSWLSSHRLWDCRNEWCNPHP
jgi:hypothetical protein